MLQRERGRRVRLSQVSMRCLGMGWRGGPCRDPRVGRELGKRTGEKFAPGS